MFDEESSTQGRPCRECGHLTEPGDRFCSNCGADLSWITDIQESAAETTSLGGVGPSSSGAIPSVGSGFVSGVEPGASVLVVSRGPGAGASYLLTGDVVLAGRAPDSDLFLDDITVSRNHAQFRRTESGWELRDEESLNGTYVNRHRIETHVLQPGDEVQIGKYRFAYLVGD